MLWTIFVILLIHVGAGIGDFVHDGWIRPHSIGHRPGGAGDQSHSGAKDLVA